ncbi:MAG: CRISPR-associated helicase Cas3' [Methanocalculus sp. MSAO_Arc2]|uniref:CRISPR-associated helicase Cas3' n=1 Tax=Methanocalculus sp. MSAO_Arc2 TaxID=2293855 RepID=UPI000FEEA182|nr:MAG: CRISPR-associated helicase Cas3' [Methanocalculus sp. MSAO_Arc2]
MYYAHSTDDPEKHDWQHLKEHLQNVADIASAQAGDFNGGELAYAGGLLHDIGKYSSEFQRRLEGAAVRIDHSTAGAREAQALYPRHLSRILEYIITGHHGGLLNYGNNETGLEERLGKKNLPDYSVYRNEITSTDLTGFCPIFQPVQKRIGFSIAFFTRMLYSCLVDADSLDTEAFTDQAASSIRGQYDSLEHLSQKFEDYMAAFLSSAEETPINRWRREIYEQCREKATLPPQIFSLTVPTGGGKTLSSMAFALEHLKRHGLKRIFYVIPYTSIIEQNAAKFRDVFGSRNVLEHHSNFDPETLPSDDFDSQDQLLKLSAENWDMPIIVTTNVQFFESLFSNKRSRCRKIHNLAGSVIILDEAQMLPTNYLKPCLQAISELVKNYNSTVVICTATQPKIGTLLDESLRPVEIMHSPQDLYEALRRVNVNDLGSLSDEELSARLQEHKQVLCIVNTRKHAQKLHDALSEHGICYHLSARMCPVHRRKHLQEIKDLLKEGANCRVVSTQLIEAGVDIDFPVVFRAIAGIDSIAQAAGRCNREGKVERGEVNVFRSTERYGQATSWQRRTAEIGRMVLDMHEDPLSLPAVADYFQRLYSYEGDNGLDRKGILSLFEKNCSDLAFPFEDIGWQFSIIEQGTKDLVIPFDDNTRTLLNELKASDRPWEYARRLQGYTIAIYPHEFKELERANEIDLFGDRFYVLNDISKYSEETGLISSKGNGGEGSLLII